MCERPRPWSHLWPNMPLVPAPTEMPVCLDAWMHGRVEASLFNQTDDFDRCLTLMPQT